MKNASFLNLILCIIIVGSSSVSHSSEEQMSPEGYWVDSYRSALVFFNEGGDMVLINREDEVIDHSLFEFVEVEHDYFTVVIDDHGVTEEAQFYKASDEDFFLGSWHWVLNKNETNVYFEYVSSDELWYMFEKNDGSSSDTRIDFEFLDGQVVIDGAILTYEIADDKHSIMLINSSYMIELTRGFAEIEQRQVSNYTEEVEEPVEMTGATFFGSEHDLWSEDARIPREPLYSSAYDPNLLVCSTKASIPVGSLLEISCEYDRGEVRTVKVVVTENDVLSDDRIGIVMEREAFSQLFETPDPYYAGYLPTVVTTVTYRIIDNL